MSDLRFPSQRDIDKKFIDDIFNGGLPRNSKIKKYGYWYTAADIAASNGHGTLLEVLLAKGVLFSDEFLEVNFEVHSEYLSELMYRYYSAENLNNKYLKPK